MRLLVVLVVAWWSAALCLPARAQETAGSATPSAPSAKPPAAKAKSPKRPVKHSSSSSRSKRGKSAHRKKRAASPRRLRRVHRAFVASSDLKPMAKQLLDDRTPAAYAGVEAYARRHAADDAGSLANLALGYAHILDHQPDKAIPPLLQARTHADELADYVSYWLGSAYAATGDSQHALDTLRDFGTRYPDSVFERDAALVYANALTATGQPKDALALLEKYQEPARSDVYLALGRALLKLGDQARAVTFLQRLYLTMPLAPEADQAGDLLQTLPPGAAAPTPAQLKIRADLLAQGKRYHDAESEYRRLLASASESDRPLFTLALAGTLHRDGDDRQARQMLEPLQVSGEANAERLFYLLEIARSDGDDDRFLHALDDLRNSGAGTRWLERGLFAAGNLYLVRNDYDRALDFYRDLAQRFPDGSLAPFANWKVAWLNLRQGHDGDARHGLEDQIARYSASAQVPAALYWRARLAEEDNDPGKAARYYRKLVDRYTNYYYADLGRDRLLKLEAAAGAVQRTASADPSDAVLEKLPPLPQSARYAEEKPPDDDLRVEKALLLENGGLIDFAIRELKAAQQEDGGSWATAEMARLYWDDGSYYRALRLLKTTVPSYLSSSMDALPRDYWEFLFPRPYWNELKRYAAANGLPPFLVASLIRQESEFNPGAVSSANAYGLMQLLPGNGRKMARELRLRYSTDALLTPTLNLAVGTRFFRQMLDHFNGNVEYALAAYNAGPDRVDAWLAAGKYRDTQEFVESIPFTETREYVQSILRNVSVYRRLYGQP